MNLKALTASIKTAAQAVGGHKHCTVCLVEDDARKVIDAELIARRISRPKLREILVQHGLPRFSRHQLERHYAEHVKKASAQSKQPR